MEEVIDKIITEVEWLGQTPESDGGILEGMPIKAVYFGDPGVIPKSLIPCAIVEPIQEAPDSETTAHDRRTLQVNVILVVDARDFFNKAATEATGDRSLVHAMAIIKAHFRRRSKRTLDGLTGVVDLKVRDTNFFRRMRGDDASAIKPLFSKEAATALTVFTSYARVLD